MNLYWCEHKYHFVYIKILLYTLLQFATFPGYTPAHPTPLPHGMLTLEQMKRVTRAQTGLAIKVTSQATFSCNVELSVSVKNGQKSIP